MPSLKKTNTNRTPNSSISKNALVYYNRFVDVSEPIVFMSVKTTDMKRKRINEQYYRNPVINALLKNRFDLSHRLIKVKVTAVTGKSTSVEISMWNEDQGITEHPVLQKGTLITLVWGYPGLVTRPRTFKVQKIKGTRARVRVMGIVTIVATASGTDMNARPISRAFRNRTASDVANRIRREWGFTSKKSFIIQDEESKQSWFQTNQTDWQFLSMLSQQKGWQFSAEDDEFIMGPSSRIRGGKSIVSYTYFADETGWVKRFEPETSTLNRTGKTTVKGKKKTQSGKVSKTAQDIPGALGTRVETNPAEGNWVDVSKLSAKERIRYVKEAEELGAHLAQKRLRDRLKAHRKSDASKPGIAPSETVIPATAATQSKLKEEATVRQHNMMFAGAKARLIVDGDPLLWKNRLIAMSGSDNYMDGLWRVFECEHILDYCGYEVICKLRRDAVGKKGKKKPEKKKKPKSTKKKPRVAHPVETYTTGYSLKERLPRYAEQSVRERGYKISYYHHR